MKVEPGVARTASSMAADALRRRRCLLVTCRRIQAVGRSVAHAPQAPAEFSSIGDKRLYINYSE
jgi:hypothetical protein